MRTVCERTDAPIWRLRLEPDRDGGEIVLSAAGLERLLALCAAAAAEGSPCRALVLEGADGRFCRGMDLDALGERPAEHAGAGVEQYASCLRALRDCPRPLIALVDGDVAAGGVGLAAVADVLVATRRSTFALPEVVLGLVPAMVFPVLCERMAPQRARRLALLGQALAADEAQRLGLVDEVVADAEALEGALTRLARQLLRVQPAAVARLKRLARDVAARPFDEGLAAGAACTAALLAEPGTVAQVRAFLDGEPLPWFARYRPRAPDKP